MIIIFYRKETGDLLQDLVNFAADKAKKGLFGYQDLGRREADEDFYHERTRKSTKKRGQNYSCNTNSKRQEVSRDKLMF